MNYLKAEQTGTAKWRVLAIPFGGPFKGGRDTDGEFFSPRTDIKPDWFAQRPVIWHHGFDDSLKDETLGIEDDLDKKDDGWWATMWLNRSARYWDQINEMLAAGKVFGSSGAIGHLVRKSKDGEILVWPHAEQTLTPTPANIYSRVTASKAVDHFRTAGITLDPAVRSILDDLDKPSADLLTNLPSGGDAEAIQRLSGETARLLERLKSI